MSLRRPRFEDEEPASEINISPLIDVIFILLIFFIVTMVFADNDAMGVDVPSAENSQTPDSNAVNVAITYDGSVLLDGEKYGINSENIDDIILKIASGAKASHGFEDVKNSIKIPQKDLLTEQDTLAQLKKYNLGIQNVKISSNVEEYLKKNIIMKKDKK